MSPIDRYSYDNRFSLIAARTKILLGMLFLLTGLCVPFVPLQFGIVVIVVGLLLYGRIPWRALLRFYAIPFGFLLISLLSILLSLRTEGGVHIVFERRQIPVAIALASRALATMSGAYFIALTTPLPQQVAFLKSLHVPEEILELMVLIYRFISIFLEEFLTMHQALVLRFYRNSLSSTVRGLSVLASGIFSRIMKSYDRWREQLELKFFNGSFHV